MTQLVMPAQLAAILEMSSPSQPATPAASGDGIDGFLLALESLLQGAATMATSQQQEAEVESDDDAKPTMDFTPADRDESNSDQLPGPVTFVAAVLDKPYRTWLLPEGPAEQPATAERGVTAASTATEDAVPIETLQPATPHTAFEPKFQTGHTYTDDRIVVTREPSFTDVEDADTDPNLVPAKRDEPDDDQLPALMPFLTTVIEKPDRTWPLQESGVNQPATAERGVTPASAVKEDAAPIETQQLAVSHTAFELKFQIDRASVTEKTTTAQDPRVTTPLTQGTQEAARAEPAVTGTVEAAVSDVESQVPAAMAAAAPKSKPQAASVLQDERSEPLSAQKPVEHSDRREVPATNNKDQQKHSDERREESPLPRHETSKSHVRVEPHATGQTDEAASAVHRIAELVQTQVEGNRLELRATNKNAAPQTESRAIEPPQVARQQVSSVKLTVQTESGHSVDLRISDRRGSVHIVARTSDPEMSAELKKGVPQLLSALQNTGISGPIETVATSEQRQQDGESSSRQFHEEAKREQAQEERRDRRRQHRQRGNDAFEARLNSIQGLN